MNIKHSMTVYVHKIYTRVVCVVCASERAVGVPCRPKRGFERMFREIHLD